jgi:hypothetical protein
MTVGALVPLLVGARLVGARLVSEGLLKPGLRVDQERGNRNGVVDAFGKRRSDRWEIGRRGISTGRLNGRGEDGVGPVAGNEQRVSVVVPGGRRIDRHRFWNDGSGSSEFGELGEVQYGRCGGRLGLYGWFGNNSSIGNGSGGGWRRTVLVGAITVVLVTLGSRLSGWWERLESWSLVRWGTGVVPTETLGEDESVGARRPLKVDGGSAFVEPVTGVRGVEVAMASANVFLPTQGVVTRGSSGGRMTIAQMR